VAADTQQPAKVAKIGWLTSGSLIGTDVRSEFLRQELSKLGYIEGKNLAIEFRSSEGKVDQLPGLAEELVRLKVDVIYANSATSAAFAKKATQTIPIVFLSSAEPVSAGLISSWATWWQPYRIRHHCRGIGWQTTGVAQGCRSEALSRCNPLGAEKSRF
jgi:putative ABC transport system substrate-binding protein